MKEIYEKAEARIKKVNVSQGLKVFNFNWENKSIDVFVPFERTPIYFELQGATEEELVQSFVNQLNQTIKTMVWELEECILTGSDVSRND